MIISNKHLNQIFLTINILNQFLTRAHKNKQLLLLNLGFSDEQIRFGMANSINTHLRLKIPNTPPDLSQNKY